MSKGIKMKVPAVFFKGTFYTPYVKHFFNINKINQLCFMFYHKTHLSCSNQLTFRRISLYSELLI